MATTFLLIRHAAHDRVDHVLCGRMPGVHLGAAGRAQAEALARSLAREPVAALHTSPAARCRETAAPLATAFGLGAAPDDAMDEIDFGAWTGQSFAALAPDPRWREWNIRRDTATAPGGESMAAAQARGIEALRQRYGNETVAVVSHCDIIKAVLSHHLGLPLQAYARFEISPASVSRISVRPGGACVLAMNERAPA
jgi:probable phosphoglycerate mutase